MKKATTIQQLKGLAYFALGVAALLAFLTAANRVPFLLHEGTMRSYVSVEEVRRELNISDIPMPSYIPESLIWPPAAILAQTTPYEAVVIEFKGAGGAISLVIARSASEEFDPGRQIRLKDVRETAVHNLRGRNATIETGACSDGLVCSRIWWNEEGHRIIVIMRASTMELLRIAESIIDSKPRVSDH